MDSSSKSVSIKWRSLIIGALLIPLNAFLIVRLERTLFGPYPSTISLFANTVFGLFVLVGLNALLRRWVPRVAFTQGEMLVIYTMAGISTGLAGLDGVPSLNQVIPEGAWFGAENRWTDIVGAFPRWLTVTNRDVLRGHFQGNYSFYHPEVLRAWATPILCWTLFVVLLLFVANCINVLVRPQWADRERLTFPIVWLPVAMTDGGAGGAFFRSGLMWIGFGIAGGLNLWNGLAFLYPWLPTIPLGITDLRPLMTTHPWNAIDWFPITFYPLVIGLGFLLPVDLLFSCWVFLLMWKAQMVFTSLMAWDTMPDFPFIKEQGFGAIVGLFLFYLWSGRRAYLRVLQRAFRPSSERTGSTFETQGARVDTVPTPGPRIPDTQHPIPDTRHPTPHTPPLDPPPAQEAISERAALFGILAGVAGLWIFWLVAKVTWWVAPLFFIIYIPTLVVVARIRAELGSPVHDFHFMGPDNMVTRLLGTQPLSQHDLAFFTFGWAFTRAHRSDTMPVGLEGLQVARMRQMESRRMFIAILIAIVLGTLAAFWAFEHQAYQEGGTTKFGQGFGFAHESYSRMASWVAGSLDRHPNLPATAAMVVGLVVTLLLFVLRLRFFGFPLHPIGFAISSSWSINLVWVPMLIAWVLKGLTLRYGGLKAYRRFLPFFLGLILGDCVMGSVWMVLSLLLNMRTYNFFGD